MPAVTGKPANTAKGISASLGTSDRKASRVAAPKRRRQRRQAETSRGRPASQRNKKRSEQGKHANAGSTRCRHDYAGKKCPYGDKCRFEHKNAAVNKIKPAASVDYSNHTCNACGEKGHITFGCPKVKKHAADIKAATSFKGDHGWFKAEANVKKFRELVKVRGWFAARAAKKFDWERAEASGG